jgi:pimeloyl-ACP methyl ester carboxylesterase
MKIFAIHGAFSTPTIFNYLVSKITDAKWQPFDYSNQYNDFHNVCDAARNAIKDPCHLIGHSMGGIIALSLADHPNIQSVTTIASPLAGLSLNPFQSYMSRSNFIRDLQKGSSFMRQIQQTHYSVPIQHIITTQGFNPYMTEDNDGVVTLKSQTDWAAGTVHALPYNHAEVMLSIECVKKIKKFIQLHNLS